MDTLTQEWLAGLASFGSVFVELVPDEKRTKRRWEFYESLHQLNGGPCLEQAIQWLLGGSGLGILPRSDLWALDVDSGPQVERVLSALSDARVIAPYVSTPSGGAHFYFRKPESFEAMGKVKNHLCHPKNSDGEKLEMDFKLGPRTLLVALGTCRNGKFYTPQTPWLLPPVLDPRVFLPEGQFWMPPNKPFAVDDRPLERRTARACVYLRTKAPISVSGVNGGRALAAVAAYLVAFLQLDPALAFYLLINGKQPWNSRCRTKNAESFPWSHSELWRACTDAVDAIPEAGVRLYQRRQERARRDKTLSTFMEILLRARTGEPCPRIWVQDLRLRYQAWSREYISETAFGLALSSHGISRVKFTRAKLPGVESVDVSRLDSLLRLAPAA